MSSTAKGTVLRLITPWDRSSKTLSALGPQAKLESSNLVLTAGRLTTEDIVRLIRELARLRDELLHSMRQLGISREARKSIGEKPEYDALLAEGQAQLEQRRKKYQEAQSRVEALERQIGEARKDSDRISEVAEAGFTSAGNLSATGQLTKLLGRLPIRKIEAARRALESALKDEAIFSTGNRKKDLVYVLVAVPTDKVSVAHQTLILYDFVQTETPASEEPDLKKTLALLREKQDALAKQLSEEVEETKKVKEETVKSLNELADKVHDSLIMLRGVLKLGEGTKASHTFAWLEKNPSPKMIASLISQGALVETE